MNTNLEERLAAGMRERVAGLALTGDVLAEATRRHRRRTALVRTAYAVGVVGALAAVATLGTGVPGRTGVSPAPVAERPPGAGVESPQLRLAAAAEASENISYRVKVTTTWKDKAPANGELPEPVSQSWVTMGAFDPTTATGYLESPYTGLRPVVAAGFEHERLIDGVRYIGAPNGSVGSNGEIVWSQEPGRHDRLNFDLALDGGLGASADPQDLFRALGQSGAKVTETAGGGYHFEVTVTDLRNEIAADSFVGDVTLGADNRIATVTYDRVARSTIKGENFTYHLHVVIELSGYGLPVQVERPAGARVRFK
ncbi:hypothetical protein ACVCAH_18055 [Micromonospora sp. LZ34]